jgi:hypothetical protein
VTNKKNAKNKEIRGTNNTNLKIDNECDTITDTSIIEASK